MNRAKKSSLLITLLLSCLLYGCGTTTNHSDVVSEKVEVTDTNEESSETTMVGNPWTDSDEAGVLEATGFDMVAPQGATDVLYSYMEETKLAQMTYTQDGASWVYRMQATNALEDISGMNYEWGFNETGTVSGRDAVYMGYSDAPEDSEYIDGAESVQVVNWYDVVPGVCYSLSASGTDLNGMDIQVYAEELFKPLQSEVDGDEQAEKGSLSVEKYANSAFSLEYDKDAFFLFEDDETGAVTLSYCKEGVEAAGSNVITFFMEKDADAKKLLEEKVEAIGADKANISEVFLATIEDTCYSYSASGQSDESGLKTVQMLYAVPCKEDVIYIEAFRTEGSDEATEMAIDAGFEYIMETFKLEN